MSNQLIQPRTLSGFRDFLPEMMIPREKLMETARKVYRSYGFVPIDTPTLELSEILCGKGSEETDRQIDFEIDDKLRAEYPESFIEPHQRIKNDNSKQSNR